MRPPLSVGGRQFRISTLSVQHEPASTSLTSRFTWDSLKVLSRVSRAGTLGIGAVLDTVHTGSSPRFKSCSRNTHWWHESTTDVSLREGSGQALAHTHRPFAEMIDFLTSPGGGLLWDIFLLALGICITVFILQRYLERQEEKRWRPARRDLYRRLFSHADWLIRMVPRDVRGGWPKGRGAG
jgi:hypothetical protein